MKLFLFIILISLPCLGQCRLCDVNEPETTWTDRDNYVIHYAIHDTVKHKYDTTFTDTVGELGLKWRKIQKIDTFYMHTNFDMKNVSRPNDKFTGRRMKIILK